MYGTDDLNFGCHTRVAVTAASRSRLRRPVSGVLGNCWLAARSSPPPAARRHPACLATNHGTTRADPFVWNVYLQRAVCSSMARLQQTQCQFYHSHNTHNFNSHCYMSSERSLTQGKSWRQLRCNL